MRAVGFRCAENAATHGDAATGIVDHLDIDNTQRAPGAQDPGDGAQIAVHGGAQIIDPHIHGRHPPAEFGGQRGMTGNID